MFAPPKSKVMDIDQRNSQSTTYSKFRAIMHLTMGVFYFLFGVVIIYMKSFGTMELSSGLAYTIGVMLFAYGAFRIWRGLADMRMRRNG